MCANGLLGWPRLQLAIEPDCRMEGGGQTLAYTYGPETASPLCARISPALFRAMKAAIGSQFEMQGSMRLGGFQLGPNLP